MISAWTHSGRHMKYTVGTVRRLSMLYKFYQERIQRPLSVLVKLNTHSYALTT